MNEKKELTASDLALYLGCEVLFENEVYVLEGVNERVARPYQICIGPWVKIKDVKPILRPLWDMLVDERQDIEDIGLHRHELQAEFHRVKYLLSKHFDLFGWIEAGLAIDKTKI